MQVIGKPVLCARTVDGLRPGARDVIVWDRDLPGFGVRVYPSGRKVWVVQSRGGGGAPAGHPRRAWRAWRRTGAQAGRGGDPHHKERRRSGRALFRADGGGPRRALPVGPRGGQLQRAHGGDLSRLAGEPHPAGAGRDARSARSGGSTWRGCITACATGRAPPTGRSRCCRRCSRWPRTGACSRREAAPAAACASTASAGASASCRRTSTGGSAGPWRRRSMRAGPRRPRSPRSAC